MSGSFFARISAVVDLDDHVVIRLPSPARLMSEQL